jgi:hypothetical protein
MIVRFFYIREIVDHHSLNFLNLIGGLFKNLIYTSGHRGHRGLDCMVVGFTTTCAISAYHH